MKLYHTTEGILLEAAATFYHIEESWDVLINDDTLYGKLRRMADRLPPLGDVGESLTQLLLPTGNQEIWASGVTYFNSKLARQEESEKSGGGSFYERVYHAERPELFFKSTAARAVPSGGEVRIRRDSDWNVPEPELTLVVTASGKIVGYTIGNDMSSRSIEGENPLYLPQAKTYDGCAGLGPSVYVPQAPLPEDTAIRMEVVRSGVRVFDGATRLRAMKRKPEELVAYLYRECSFPRGCLLMTGTGIVPEPEFTLAGGDEIRITIDLIGTLINFVR